MIVDGHRINTFGKPPEETAKIIRNIVNLPVREDDVFLVTPPKSGKLVVLIASVPGHCLYFTIDRHIDSIEAEGAKYFKKCHKIIYIN